MKTDYQTPKSWNWLFRFESCR